MTEPRKDRLGFPLDARLSDEMLSTIEQVRLDPGGEPAKKALIETVLKLTDAGLHEYYVRPLEQAGAGMIAMGTARLGIGTARRGISVIVNKVLRGLGEDQLRSIADSIEGLLIRGADET